MEDSNFYPILISKIKNLGDSSGCYLWKDKSQNVIYVGKAVRLQSRVRSYLNPNITDLKTLSLQKEIFDLEWIITNTEEEALILEANLIKKYNPKYNIRLKDDKKYPFLCISLDEMYPRIFLTRTVRSDGKLYFGPYTDVKATRDLLNLIHKIFPIRKKPLNLPKEKPNRPCLNYFMKRCLAPCMGNVPQKEYLEIIEEIKKFLSGNKTDLVRDLKIKMEAFSDKLMFEKAAIYRDTIYSVQTLNNRQNIINSTISDEDILAIHTRENACQLVVFEVRDGKLNGKKSFALDGYFQDEKEKEVYNSFLKLYYLNNSQVPKIIRIPMKKDKELNSIESSLTTLTQAKIKILSSLNSSVHGIYKMAKMNAEKDLMERILSTKLKDNQTAILELQSILKLKSKPLRIECYDISHFQGANPVGSGVMFVNGIPYKQGYRIYKIRSYNSINDPGMIHEVLSRRLQRLFNENLEKPDLIVIDGGYTQLSRAVEALQNFSLENIPLIGLAKKREEIYVPWEKNPYTFPINNPGLRLLQRIRDEAHRFAITFHRKQRKKSTLSLLLDGLQGVGISKKKKIYQWIVSQNIQSPLNKEELKKLVGTDEPTFNALMEKLKLK